MTQPSAQSVPLTPARKQRDQEDRKRMQYRRAIEELTEQRRLQLESLDFPELIIANSLKQGTSLGLSRPH